MSIQVCYWSHDRGELLREVLDRVPATGEVVELAALGILGRVVLRDFAPAPDGTEELLIELELAPGIRGRRR